jgi:hypothetical protein
MMRENRKKKQEYEDKIRETKRRTHEEDDTEAKMDEYTHIIQNIVYARDPKIFDTKNGFVNQKEAFMHENRLDIKSLIKNNEDRMGNNDNMGRRAPNPKRLIKTKEMIDREKEFEAKARYKLREENG